jgi:hypothetical protein
LRQKQKLLRFERFRRGAITDPMFLKAQHARRDAITATTTPKTPIAIWLVNVQALFDVFLG